MRKKDNSPTSGIPVREEGFQDSLSLQRLESLENMFQTMSSQMNMLFSLATNQREHGVSATPLAATDDQYYSDFTLGGKKKLSKVAENDYLDDSATLDNQLRGVNSRAARHPASKPSDKDSDSSDLESSDGEGKALKALRTKSRRNSDMYEEEHAQRVRRTSVQKLEFNQKKVDGVRKYFTDQNGMFLQLTFENYVRWDSVRRTYQRSFADEWDNSWHESFSKDMQRELYTFNYRPTDKAKDRSTFGGDISIGVVFASVKNESPAARRFLADGIEFNSDTELSELPIANVIDLVMLAVAPDSWVDFRDSFMVHMKKKFKIRDGDCSLNFKKLPETDCYNFADHYGIFVNFLDEAQRTYHTLLTLQEKAKLNGRTVTFPTYDVVGGSKDMLKLLCKLSGAKYILSLITMIHFNPTDAVTAALKTYRDEEFTHKKSSKAPRFLDQKYGTTRKLKVMTLDELFTLLRVDMDDEYVTSKPIVQRRAGNAKYYPSETNREMNAMSFSNSQDVRQVDNTKMTLEDTDSQDDSDPPELALAAMTPQRDQSRYVCIHKLTNRKCPGADSCIGAKNENPKDKAAYVARELPFAKDKAKYWTETVAALQESAKKYPSSDRGPQHNLRAITNSPNSYEDEHYRDYVDGRAVDYEEEHSDEHSDSERAGAN